MLKRGIEVLVGVALVAVALAVLPAVAEAQEGASSTHNPSSTQNASVVVGPGDTLWSISGERLGPGAAPQRIANDVERIYARNRDRIGPDPNLLLVGEKLSLPAVGSPATRRRAEDSAPSTARESNGPAQAAQVSTRAARDKAKQAPDTAAGGKATDKAADKENGRAERAHDQAADQLADLPKPPKPTAVPAARPTASPVSSFFEAVRSAADERKLLGWGTIGLTLLVGATMAWKLPMRRTVGTRETWRIPQGIRPYPLGSYAYRKPTQPQQGAPRTSATSPEARAPASENGAHRLGLRGVARSRRERILRERASGPHPRNGGLAPGAHNHDIQRALLSAALRPRLRARRMKGGR